MRLTSITLPWADGEYTFDLPLKQVRTLQEKTGLGPAVILNRLQSDQWKVDDYRETILQGLIGGGMEPVRAAALIKTYIDDRPAREGLVPAQAILMAWIVGAPQSKKADAPKPETPTTTAAGDSTSA